LPFLDDRGGTIRGYRIFTACRTVRGKIFRLNDHLERLYSSASGILMKPPLQERELRELLGEVVERNVQVAGNSDLLIDVIFSGGLEGNTMKQSPLGAYLYVAVQEMVPPPRECYEEGVGLATFPHQRSFPQVKLLNYVAAVLAHQTVVSAHDAYDVLFIAPSDGQTILEGSTFTIFFVDSGGQILTPPLDGSILDSVTRRVLFEILAPTPQKIRGVPIRLDMTTSFTEAFLASTTRNVVPVTSLDDKRIGAGVPGPVTRAVADLLEAHIDAY